MPEIIKFTAAGEKSAFNWFRITQPDFHLLPVEPLGTAYGYDQWHQFAFQGNKPSPLGGGIIRIEIKIGDLGFLPINGIDEIKDADFNQVTWTWCERASGNGDGWGIRLVGGVSPDLWVAFTA